jgi:TadE-like protein
VRANGAFLRGMEMVVPGLQILRRFLRMRAIQTPGLARPGSGFMHRDVDPRAKRGNAVVEASLMAPWIFLLFIGVFDFGFFAYASICTQNAARVAALANAYSEGSAADNATACSLVLQEMNALPNTRSLAACTGTLSATQPIIVQANAVIGPDGAKAAEVSVTYLSIPLFPIPGVMKGQITLTRIVRMRVFNATPAI